MKLGLALTVAYIIVIAIFIPILSPDALDKVSGMGLNEWGDFLAGVFGPVAFLWLILGYGQQGEELKQNTEALCLQVQELSNSVKQQEMLVKTTQDQLEVEKQRQLITHRREVAYARPRLELRETTSTSKKSSGKKKSKPHQTDKKNKCLIIENTGGDANKFDLLAGGDIELLVSVNTPMDRLDRNRTKLCPVIFCKMMVFII